MAIHAYHIEVKPVKQSEIDQLRQILLTEEEELRSLSVKSIDGRAPIVLDQQSQGRLSRMDAMQQQSMGIAHENRRRLRLRKIAAALMRMDEDVYGYCLGCGDEIAYKRLAADATALHCFDCVSKKSG